MSARTHIVLYLPSLAGGDARSAGALRGARYTHVRHLQFAVACADRAADFAIDGIVQQFLRHVLPAAPPLAGA